MRFFAAIGLHYIHNNKLVSRLYLLYVRPVAHVSYFSIWSEW